MKNFDPTGLYDLNNTCGANDAKCNKQFDQHAKDLKKGLSDLQKKVDKVKDPTQKTRLENALNTFGTEGDHNGVNVSFGATGDGAAGQTTPVFNQQTGQETFNVILDPSKLNSTNDYAVDAAHEGTHVDDIKAGLANQALPALSYFSLEYRGYQTSAWAAQALGYDNLNIKGNVIWNSSWSAADRPVLQDRGVTRAVIGLDPPGQANPPHAETQPHNPWPN
jgi:hypothetical protein